MIKKFIIDCKDIIDQARSEGATIPEIHQIFQEVWLEISGLQVPFSTFKSVIYHDDYLFKH